MSLRKIKLSTRTKSVLKLIVAGVLLTVLVFSIDWRETLPRLQHLDWIAALLGLAVLAAEFPVCAWKWQQALRIHDLDWRVRGLLPIHCSAFFFNNFFPSGIGGDGYRAWRTFPATRRSRAVSAILLDRMAGFAAMLALAGLGAIWLVDTFSFAIWLLLVLCMGGMVLVVALYGLYRGWFKTLAARLRRLPGFSVVDENARLLMRRHPAWIELATGVVAFQLLAAAWVYFVFASIGVSLGWAECTMITAAAGLGSLLPVSVGGIGVVEGSIAGAAVALGVPYDLAVAGALLNRLGTFPASIVCGFVYLLQRGPSVPVEAHAVSHERGG